MTTFANAHALLVGVGDDLPNTEDDARGLAQILADPERCAYAPRNVSTLVGADATRENVLAALATLALRSDKESTVVVFFSGHGYQVRASTGPQYYLMPYGYDLDALFETAISGREFADGLKAIPAARMLVLLDCCHAGGVGEEKAPPAGLKLSKAPLPPEAQALFARGAGRVMIASSRADELSYAGKPYSAFTLALIEALSGEGAAKDDGFVRWLDLALHTRQMVPQRTKDKQHPIADVDHADNFALAYYAAGSAVKKGLPFQGEPEIEEEPGMMSGVVNKAGRDIIDARGAQGAIFNPTGPVTQTFGGPVDTGGGAYVAGSVRTGGGDFVGRDRVVHGNEITGLGGVDLEALLRGLRVAVAAAPPAVQSEATRKVEELKAEVQKGRTADDSRLATLIDGLVALVPGAMGAIVGLFATPVLSGMAGNATKYVLGRIRGE